MMHTLMDLFSGNEGRNISLNNENEYKAVYITIIII